MRILRVSLLGLLTKLMRTRLRPVILEHWGGLLILSSLDADGWISKDGEA